MISLFWENLPELFATSVTSFQKLRDANLKLKVQKCSFCQESVQFLGHIVSSKGLAADPAKIQRVVDWPIPTTKREV